MQIPCETKKAARRQPLYVSPQTNRANELEVESHLGGIRARRHKMRAAERRQEVIKRNFVRQVDHCEAQAPLVAISVEQIVVPDAEIKQVTRSDAGRIVIVVFGSRSRQADA